MTIECNGEDNESWPLAKQTNVYTQSTETPTQNSLHLTNWISNSMCKFPCNVHNQCLLH